MIHAVKALPEYFEALESGEKTFEVRKNDRPYKTGDFLAVNEFVPKETVDPYSLPIDFFRSADKGYYTGSCLLFEITYILDKPEYCAGGMVILALKKVDLAGG